MIGLSKSCCKLSKRNIFLIILLIIHVIAVYFKHEGMNLIFIATKSQKHKVPLSV